VENNYILVALFIVSGLFSSVTLYAEGTKQVRPSQSNQGALYIGGDAFLPPFALFNSNPNHRLYINIQNINETILFGFNRLSSIGPPVTFQLYNPADVVAMSGTLLNTNNTAGHIDSYAQAVEGPFPPPVGTGYLPLSYKVTNPSQLGNYYLYIKRDKFRHFSKTIEGQIN